MRDRAFTRYKLTATIIRQLYIININTIFYNLLLFKMYHNMIYIYQNIILKYDEKTKL